MKERQILFSAPMVRAILEGRKTQTRRAVKMKPWHSIEERDDGQQWPWMYDGDRDADYWLPCPYGQPGDRLWVRETWAPYDDYTMHLRAQGDVFYRADCLQDFKTDGRWRPSIHMPRWASRILLEITDVRVERLQDISEEDAIAEGARHFPDIYMATPSASPCRWSMESPENTDQCLSTPRYAFANLFSKVNGKGRGNVVDFSPWDANPLVWVIEFRRAEA